jgi:glucose dehydrogenase
MSNGGLAGIATAIRALDQISKDNVAELKIAWRRPAVDSW